MSGKGFSPDPPPNVFGLRIDAGEIDTGGIKIDPSAADRLLTWKEILEKALAAHTTGRLDEAERLYRLVLEKDPREPNALTNLGTIFLQRGQTDQGVDLIGQSLEIKPNQAHALTNLGNALNGLRRFEEALDVCQRAVALQPDSHDAYNNLGNVLRELGRTDEALAAYGKAAELQPGFVVALSNKGNMLRALGRHDEALAVLDQQMAVQGGADVQNERGNVLVDLKRSEEALAEYEAALALNPHYTEAWGNKAVALQMLDRLDEALAASETAILLNPAYAGAYFIKANVLQAQKRSAEAVEFYERAIARQPDYPEAFNNLGNALQGLQRWEDAMAAYEQAHGLRVDLAPAYANRGFVLRELGRFEEALAAYDKATALDPKFLDALNNRGVVLNELRRFEEAIEAFDQASAADPEFVDSPWNKSLVLLMHERYAEGWPLYEWRWRRPEHIDLKTPFMEPDWLEKADVTGKTVQLRGEQGLGDTLQMLRYAPVLADRGARVVMAVQVPLGEITAAVTGVSEVIVEGEKLPPCDLHCAIMSLPFAFGTTIDTIPQGIPYVWTSQAARETWAARIGPKTRPRIGLAWSGSRTHKNDHNRSMPLKTLLPLLDTDADFVSLQIEYREADEALLDADGRIRRFDGEIKSFMDTAALIEQMDLVIAVDTSVAHMAGALGKPLWVMLPRTPDFRWHIDRPDSPWYPTARLFRQPDFGDWDSVVREMSEAAANLQPCLDAQALPPAPVNPHAAEEQAAREAAIIVFNRKRQMEKLHKRYEALNAEGRTDEALAVCREAVSLRPDYAPAFFDLGSVQSRIMRLDDCADPVIAARLEEAAIAFRRALELKPDYIEALNELGRVLRLLGRPAEALPILERGRELAPTLSPIYGNLGNVLQDLGRYDEALAAFGKAIEFDPNSADAHWNKALLYFLTERYEEAWPLYEWRWRREVNASQNVEFLEPSWFAPQNLPGKTVLIRAEQGLGDTLQMIRYAPLLKARGAKVILCVQPTLYELARSVEGVDQVIMEGEPLPPHDIRCMIMSLMLALGTTIDTIPADVPYISVSEALRQAWANKLGPRTRPRIGLVWSGNPGHTNDRNRSMPLKALLPLLDLDADFVSLQVDYREADLALLEADGRIRRFDAEIQTFTDTAALVENLDLVVCVDTSVAHLAGALAKPVWMILARRADFRWHLNREDTPWYPTARLFRQKDAGDWDSLVSRIAEAIKATVL